MFCFDSPEQFCASSRGNTERAGIIDNNWVLRVWRLNTLCLSIKSAR